MSSGLRNVNGLNVLPMDGLWQSVAGVESDSKLTASLEYAGCPFLDEEMRLVGGNVVALVGVGGIPLAVETDTDQEIDLAIKKVVVGSRQMMGSSAAFSYLNSGEKDILDLYKKVTELGHTSIAHTVYLNFVVAGISEGAELELNLQRDIVHISKLTNARTRVQNTPPLVARNPANAELLLDLHKRVSKMADEMRTDETGDVLEIANSIFPINKATILMISGDLSNLRKLAMIREDEGKEQELREIADKLYGQLLLLWPELIN